MATEVVQKDRFGRALNYVSPIIEYTSVKKVVQAWVNGALNGLSDEEKRSLLPQIDQATHLIVDFVMQNLPNGVKRVDGATIRPIARDVANEIKVTLPKPESTEEII